MCAAAGAVLLELYRYYSSALLFLFLKKNRNVSRPSEHRPCFVLFVFPIVPARALKFISEYLRALQHCASGVKCILNGHKW